MANKRLRKKLAKAELWLHLAVTVQRWSDDVAGKSASCRPMAEWGPADPLVQLSRTYQLSEADLAKLLAGLADELERRAIKAGYDEAWVDA